MIIFGTGHRDCAYTFYDMVDIAEEALMSHDRAIDAVICGMAAGFDLALGKAAMRLGIDIWSVRPWAGHAPRAFYRHIYQEIEEAANQHTVLYDSLVYPGPYVFHARNHYMVKHANEGLAFWDGREVGGTYECISHAHRRRVPVCNIYPGNEVWIDEWFEHHNFTH